MDMSDKERLLALLKDFGLTPSEYGQGVVRLEAGSGGVHGHSGFFVDFEFTADGTFEDVGVYE